MSSVETTQDTHPVNSYLNIGSGEDYREHWENIDLSPEVSPDAVCDIGQDRWPYPDNSFKLAEANHVFEHLDFEGLQHAFMEASRVLEPGGTLIVRVPTGTNALTDPTHRNDTPWTFDTGVFFAANADEFGDYQTHLVDTDMELVRRDINKFVGHGPGRFLGVLGRRLLRTMGPGVWVSSWPMSSAELEFEFKVIE